MGSPISPIIANLFMEDLETRALNTSQHPLTMEKVCWWYPHHHQERSQRYLFRPHKFNRSQHQIYQWRPKRRWLHILQRYPYYPRRRWQTQHYCLQEAHPHWHVPTLDSHHNIPSKYSVVGTLYHRANTICSTPQHLQKEEKHLNQALKRCKYPTWAINRAKLKIKATASHSTNRRTVNSNPTQSSSPKPNVVLPYHQGLSESFKRTCQKYGIHMHCKGGHTIKSLLIAPKDKDHILNKSWVI